MNIYRSKKYLISSGIVTMLLLCACGHYWAAEQSRESVSYDLGSIEITAQKGPVYYQVDTGGSMTVVTGEEIQVSTRRTVADILRTVPGVTVSRSGSLGGITDVYIRGAQQGKTVVIIDGVIVNDPLSIDRSYDFSHLVADSVQELSVLRGPASSLYGSDAMAGVVNITTQQRIGKPSSEFCIEGGSYSTLRESLKSSGSTDRVKYAAFFSHVDSEGISHAAGGHEHDAYHQTTMSSKAGYRFSNDSELNILLRAARTDGERDDEAYDDDPNARYTSEHFLSRISYDQTIYDWWRHLIACDYNEMERTYTDPPDAQDLYEDDDAWYQGYTQRIASQHTFSLSSWDTVTLGLEYKEEHGSSLYSTPVLCEAIDNKTVDTKAGVLYNQIMLWDSISITPGLRIDDHELFGTEPTYMVSNTMYISQTRTRLKGNWGTGFKAPTLFQLYSHYGDKALQPEESMSYDYGFEQQLLNNRCLIGVTYFHNNFKHMIEWDPQIELYSNIGHVDMKGVEGEINFIVTNYVNVGSRVYCLKTYDHDTGHALLKRPRTQLHFFLNVRSFSNMHITFDTMYVGSRPNRIYRDGFPVKITSGSYAKADLAVTYDVSSSIQINSRIENLFDRQYQEVAGYNTPGRTYYVGVKIIF